jgi:SAM-dependent methyltransferase
MDGSIYDAEYFLRGRESGKSLYDDYRWMPELTISMVRDMIAHLGIAKHHRILDYGAARGYTVKAFRQLGYEAYGIDISQWAIDNCDPDVKDCMIHTDHIPLVFDFDWIIAKDVLEHVPNVNEVIDKMLKAANVGIFAVVPLSLADNRPYIVQEYEFDITHIHRLSLASWARMFMRPGWSVTGAYMVPGIKQNYAKWEWGNGFITARRL